jgi:hypothetical protein
MTTVLFDAALKVADKELLLRYIRAQQAAVIERLQDSTAIPLIDGDNALALAETRSRESRFAWAELQLIKAQVKRTAGAQEAGSIQESVTSFHLGDWSSRELAVLEKTPVDLERLELYEQEFAPKERDEVDAICEALPDLKRLARYERRVWSRLKRALREFMEIKSIEYRCEGGTIDREAWPRSIRMSANSSELLKS